MHPFSSSRQWIPTEFLFILFKLCFDNVIQRLNKKANSFNPPTEEL